MALNSFCDKTLHLFYGCNLTVKHLLYEGDATECYSGMTMSVSSDSPMAEGTADILKAMFPSTTVPLKKISCTTPLLDGCSMANASVSASVPIRTKAI